MQQAVSTATGSHKGRPVGAELEVDDGRLVYEVELMTTDGEREVVVDAGDGKIVTGEDEEDEQTEGAVEDKNEDVEDEDGEEEEGISSSSRSTISLGEALKRALELRSGWAIEAELKRRDDRLAYFIDVRTQEDKRVALRVDAVSGEVHVIRKP